MSIFRKVVTTGIIGAFAVASYAQDIDLTKDVVLDDFENYYGDAVNQCALGGFYGYYSFGKASAGKGYWYFYKDTDGASVTDSAGNEVAKSTVPNLMSEGILNCNLNISESTNDYPYAGIGCNLIGAGDYTSDEFVDLTKITGISLKVKGSGSVRFRIETADVLEINKGWGYYGYDIKLTSDWKTVTIDVADLLLEDGAADEFEIDDDFSKSGKKCCKMAFQVIGTKDCNLQVDDIKCVGFTWDDLGFEPNTKVTNFKAAEKSKYFSVNGTSVSLNLPKAQNLNLSLNDLSGKCVQTLFTGNTASGKFNINDKNLSSGRYFVVATGKNINFTQSIVVTK